MIYEILTIFFAITSVFWAFCWMTSQIKLLENRVQKAEIEENLEIMHVMYNALKVKIKRKKELLEIQDKLIKELHEKRIQNKT